jgi:hypothetical protein
MTLFNGLSQKPGPRPRLRARLLRARGERPRGRTAKQCHELASLHSITSSARASNIGGHVEAERLFRVEVDDQLEFGRSLNRSSEGLAP